jgi:predicted secreted protein
MGKNIFKSLRKFDIRNYITHNYYLTLIAALIYMSGCSDSMPVEPSFNSSINGQTITVIPNQRITLELESALDAGCQWDYEISNNKSLILDSVGYKAKKSSAIVFGGPATEIFYFRSLKKGQSTVLLTERQEWLKNDPPIDTLQFTVYVR